MIGLLLSLALGQDLVVKADRILPVVGAPIDQGVLVVRGGLITEVGPASAVRVPADLPVLTAKVVTPGLVDGLSQVGLTGVLNDDGVDQDHGETAGALHPELRALDGYNPWEELVGWLRERGVTTVQIGPSPGGVIAGRAAVIRTVAAAPEAAALVTDGAVVFTLGEAPKRQAGAPDTRMGEAAAIRQALAGAAEYRERRKLPLADRPAVDLGQEALVDLLERRRKAVIVAHRADDLLAALRLGDEFKLDLVLAGATEGWLVRDAIAAAKVPVLVGPVMIRNWNGMGETGNANFANAARLAEVGVPLGFTGGFEDYVPKVRVVLWEAAVAAAYGLGPERALEALTLGGARAIGVADRVGSLEPGKQADLVLFDGDPFETTSHVCTVVVAGRVVSETCR